VPLFVHDSAQSRNGDEQLSVSRDLNRFLSIETGMNYEYDIMSRIGCYSEFEIIFSSQFGSVDIFCR